MTRICGRCGPGLPLGAAGGAPLRASHPSPGGTRPPPARPAEDLDEGVGAALVQRRQRPRVQGRLPSLRRPRVLLAPDVALGAAGRPARLPQRGVDAQRVRGGQQRPQLGHPVLLRVDPHAALLAGLRVAGVCAGRIRLQHQAGQPRPQLRRGLARRPLEGVGLHLVGHAGHPRPERQRADRRGDRLGAHPVDPARAQRLQHRGAVGDLQAVVDAGPRRPHDQVNAAATSWTATSMASPANDAGHRRLPGHHLGDQLRLQRLQPGHRALGGRQRLDQRLAISGAEVEPGQRGTQIRPRHTFEHVFDCTAEPLRRQGILPMSVDDLGRCRPRVRPLRVRGKEPRNQTAVIATGFNRQAAGAASEGGACPMPAGRPCRGRPPPRR